MLALQRAAGNRAVVSLARAGGRLAGAVEALAAAAERVPAAPAAGEAIPDTVRGRMEAALGADFGDVRLHESPTARAMGAEAYTQGSEIHLAPGHGDLGSHRGQELLGHELAHVVQQRAGRVPASGGRRRSSTTRRWRPRPMPRGGERRRRRPRPPPGPRPRQPAPPTAPRSRRG